MEYEILVVCKQVHRVCVEVDTEDDEEAQRLAIEAYLNDEAELLRDEVETIIDNVYE